MTGVDGELRDGEREELLKEVEDELPLWLTRSAIPNPDPVSELTDLLRFDATAIRQVVAVHTCLSEPVTRLIAALPAALRQPKPSTDRPREISAAVRGPIDWPATVHLHAGGQPGVYATRPRRRTFDTPEHRTLRWALRRVANLVRLAKLDNSASENAADETGDDARDTVGTRLAVISRTLRLARRTAWFADIAFERPTPQVRLRLARSRSAFVRTALAPAVERLLHDDTDDPVALAGLLRQRYFVPERNWQLHEVVVLIRIDRALTDVAVKNRRRKLLSATGTVAEYRLADGDTVHLRQQTWPHGSGVTSRRITTATRHGLRVAGTKPDIVVLRQGANGEPQDLVVLELKASRRHDTLGKGLTQLLGYLHDRPDLFGPAPAGWLVPLPFEELTAAEPDGDEPLWIVDAKRVAGAVVARLVPSG